MTPSISVIIPTYNRKGFLLNRALKSLFSQDDNDFEIVVIDDGSTDKTKEAIDLIANDRPVKYFYQENKGVSSARNLGVKKSSGNIIVFLDSDDELSPNFISFFKKFFLKIKDVDILFPQFILKDEFGKISYADSVKPKWMIGVGGGVVIKKNIFVKDGMWYDERLRNFEDSDLGLRLMTADYKIKSSKGPFYIYNFKTNIYKNNNGNNLSVSSGFMRDFKTFKKNNFKIYKKFGRCSTSFLYFWEGALMSKIDLRQSRYLYFKSSILCPNLRNVTHLIMSCFGVKSYIKLNTILIFLRRYFKIIKSYIFHDLLSL